MWKQLNISFKQMWRQNSYQAHCKHETNAYRTESKSWMNSEIQRALYLSMDRFYLSRKPLPLGITSTEVCTKGISTNNILWLKLWIEEIPTDLL